jgi:hypothetical protein
LGVLLEWLTTDSLGENAELGVGASDLADGIDEGSSVEQSERQPSHCLRGPFIGERRPEFHFSTDICCGVDGGFRRDFLGVRSLEEKRAFVTCTPQQAVLMEQF